jgi:prephenate dehydratase
VNPTQALGQCSKYLDERCPRARRIPFPSTAQAAILLASRASSEPSSSKSTIPEDAAGAVQDVKVVTDDNDERLRGHGAAICSSAIIERLEGSLDVIAESVQNVKGECARK